MHAVDPKPGIEITKTYSEEPVDQKNVFRWVLIISTILIMIAMLALPVIITIIILPKLPNPTPIILIIPVFPICLALVLNRLYFAIL